MSNNDNIPDDEKYLINVKYYYKLLDIISDERNRSANLQSQIDELEGLVFYLLRQRASAAVAAGRARAAVSEAGVAGHIHSSSIH